MEKNKNTPEDIYRNYKEGEDLALPGSEFPVASAFPEEALETLEPLTPMQEAEEIIKNLSKEHLSELDEIERDAVKTEAMRIMEESKKAHQSWLQKMGIISGDVDPSVHLGPNVGIPVEVAFEQAKGLVQAKKHLIVMGRQLVEAETSGRVDALTGIANRGEFDRRMEAEYELANRNETNLSVIILDLDYFKRVNDVVGHKCGDDTLRIMGEILRNNKRKGDIVARYGGEEFAVILPGADDWQAARYGEKLRKKVAESLNKKLMEKPYSWPASEVEKLQGTASVGVCYYKGSNNEDEQFTLDQILGAADKAMYGAKETRDDIDLINLNKPVYDQEVVKAILEENGIIEGSDEYTHLFDAFVPEAKQG